VPGRSHRQAVRVSVAPPAQVRGPALPAEEPEPVPLVRVPGPVPLVRVPGPEPLVRVPEPEPLVRVPEPVRPGRALVQPGAPAAEGRIRPASWLPPCPPGRSQCPATPRTNAG
jgi:hypothetical protein